MSNFIKEDVDTVPLMNESIYDANTTYVSLCDPREIICLLFILKQKVTLPPPLCNPRFCGVCSV